MILIFESDNDSQVLLYIRYNKGYDSKNSCINLGEGVVKRVEKYLDGSRRGLEGSRVSQKSLESSRVSKKVLNSSKGSQKVLQGLRGFYKISVGSRESYNVLEDLRKF